jgi:hypothetical protein
METTALDEVEDELEALAAHIDTAVPQYEYLMAVLALAHRARSLFVGTRHLFAGRAPVAAMSLIRPLVEINILLRFLGNEPSLHVELWIAEGQRQIAAFISDYESDAFLRKRWGPPPTEQLALRDELRDAVRAARSKAVAANLIPDKRGVPVFPGTAAMVQLLGDPGAKEAYTLAYRRLGSDVHVGTWAFEKGRFTKTADGLVSYSEPMADELVPARTLVATSFASTLCIVSTALNLGIHDRADEIKRRFVPNEPAIAERLPQDEPSSSS